MLCELESIGHFGNLGDEINPYLQACLQRQSHLLLHETDMLARVYGAKTTCQQADDLDRIQFFIDKSQQLLLPQLAGNFQLLLPNSTHPNLLQHELITQLWQAGDGAVAQLPIDVTLEKSYIASLLSKHFATATAKPITLGAFYSDFIAETRLQRQHEIMAEDAQEGRALGEACSWLRFSPCGTGAVAIIASQAMYLTGDRHTRVEETALMIKQLLAEAHVDATEIKTVIHLGSPILTEIVDFHELQTNLWGDLRMMPRILKTHAVSGDLGHVNSFLFLNLARAISLNTPHFTLVLEDYCEQQRGAMLVARSDSI